MARDSAALHAQEAANQPRRVHHTWPAFLARDFGPEPFFFPSKKGLQLHLRTTREMKRDLGNCASLGDFLAGPPRTLEEVVFPILENVFGMAAK